MNYRVIALFALTGVGALSHADKTSFGVGAAVWNYEPKGNLRYQGTNADLEDQLRLSDATKGFYWVSLEHPVPVVPNISLVRTSIDSSGSGVLTSPFNFGNTTFAASENINTSLTLDQTDLILYYKLSDKQVRFDLGLDVKYVDGQASVRSITTGATASTSFKGAIPMLYANFVVKLPAGFYAGAEGSAISYSGDSLSDLRVKFGYKSKANIGVEGGYRRQNLKLDGFDQFNSNLSLEGVYFGVFARF